MLIDNSSVNSADDLGSSDPLPGRYHAIVKAADESVTNLPDAVKVEVEVLAGTVPGQERKKLESLFSTKSGQQDRLNLFCMVTGLIGPRERKNVNLRDAIGRQLIIEVEDFTTKQGAKRRGIPMYRMGMWPLGHKDVADVPLDRQFAAMHQQGQAAPQVAPQAAHVPHTAQPAASAPTAAPVGAGAASDPYAGL